MAKVLQHRRGTATEHGNFTGAIGEITYDTTDKRLVAHDGSTKGGIPVAKEAELTSLSNSVVKTVNGIAPTNGNVNVSMSAPVSSVNGMTGAVTVDVGVTSFNGSKGAVTYTAPVTSVNGKTGAVSVDVGVTSFNGSTGAVTYTAPVTSVNGQTGAVTVSTSDSTKIPISGSRGNLAGYESSGTATTINASARDSNQTGSNITVSNGSANTSWTKIVRVTAAVSVTLGSSWKWAGGSAPTIKSGGILVCCWCGSGGIANFVSPS